MNMYYILSKKKTMKKVEVDIPYKEKLYTYVN